MTQMTEHTGLVRRIQSGSVSWAHVTGVMMAALLGTFLVIGTGLAGAEVLHNAAHDARHGLSFPCH